MSLKLDLNTIQYSTMQGMSSTTIILKQGTFEKGLQASETTIKPKNMFHF